LNAAVAAVFLIQALNSGSMTSNIRESPEDPEKAVLYGPAGVIFLTAFQGFVTGVVFCNTYWKVMNKPLPPAVYAALDRARELKKLRDTTYRDSLESREEGSGLLESPVRAAQEEPDRFSPLESSRSDSEETALREFLLSTVAPPDVISVAVASVFGMGVQRGLCAWQRSNGRDLCAFAT
jgi:hypothetical protein